MASSDEDKGLVQDFGTGSDDTNSESHNKASEETFDSTFSIKTLREDVTLVVQGKKLHVVSGILSLMSPVFTRMFEDQFRHESGPREIELKEKKLDDVVEFLLCLYPNVQKDINFDNVFTVLPLALEYDAKLLIERCKTFLQTKINSETKLEDLCLYLSKTCAFDQTGVREKCIDILSECDYAELQKAEEKYPLPLDAKVEIQQRVIKSLEQKLVRMGNSNKNYENLRKVNIRKIWFGNDWEKKLAGFENGCVGYLEFSCSIPNKGTPVESPAISIYGISWRVLVNISRKGDHLGSFLQTRRNQWQNYRSCRVYAIFVLRNFKNEDDSLCNEFDSTISEDNPGWGYPEFIEMKRLTDSEEGFMEDDNIWK